jgi:hypothetical protein
MWIARCPELGAVGHTGASRCAGWEKRGVMLVTRRSRLAIGPRGLVASFLDIQRVTDFLSLKETA